MGQVDNGSFRSFWKLPLTFVVIYIQRLSAPLLLHLRSPVKPMREVESGTLRPQFHGRDGRKFMIAEVLKILAFSAIPLFLVFIAARSAKRKYGISFRSLFAGIHLRNNFSTDRMFEKQHISALKKCRNCSRQLPLSALICDDCGYNFLSGMVGHGHAMLPAPEPPTQEVSKQHFAPAGV